MDVIEHWHIEPTGKNWTIRPQTDWASLTMQEVGTPPDFPTKRAAWRWLNMSLMDHLPAVLPAVQVCDEDGACLPVVSVTMMPTRVLVVTVESDDG